VDYCALQKWQEISCLEWRVVDSQVDLNFVNCAEYTKFIIHSGFP
jgi:hypothetical protein